MNGIRRTISAPLTLAAIVFSGLGAVLHAIAQEVEGRDR